MLITPHSLINNFPLSAKSAKFIQASRAQIHQILNGQDKRKLIIVGPCSIHDVQAGLEYAYRLQTLSVKYADDVLIVMRGYFEKPRSVLGWKGLLRDPYLDGSFDITAGLSLARKLLLSLAELQLPVATEFLDTFTPPFIADLISWTAVGARTVQSPLHREMASGLDMPVGFKNSTEGNVEVAIEAVLAARQPHTYIGFSTNNLPTVIETSGNLDAHVVLRGSSQGINYTPEDLAKTCRLLKEKNLVSRFIVDCSHGNSAKNPMNQIKAALSLKNMFHANDSPLGGIMLESYLVGGHQAMNADNVLTFGQSVTDSCLSWEETERLIKNLLRAN